MSVNSISTAVDDRNTSNINSVISPKALDSSGVNKVDTNVKPNMQELTKPVLADEKVSLSDYSRAKVSPDKADNINTVSGKVEEAGKKSQDEEQTLQQSLQKMAENTNQLSPMQNRKLEFSTSQESGRTIVKVIDKENDDVIRQIPSEEFIRVAEKISDLSEQMNAAQGLLFESKV